jgi:hypothetical protein
LDAGLAAKAGVTAWAVVLAWLTYGRRGRVPLLSLVDLGFHELGHLVTYPLPWDAVTAAMGSITQVCVPLGLAVYFLLLRRDRIGAGVCAAWAGTAARDASVYIRDAPYERLQLIGGEHDWAFVLAPHLSWAAPIATAVALLGGLLLIVGGLVPWWPDEVAEDLAPPPPGTVHWEPER